MRHYYLFWATGRDRPGIVAAVTKRLFELRCNLEDSSMMRLGSEFAVLLIFTSDQTLNITSRSNLFISLEKKWKLSVGLKKISRTEAKFQAPRKSLFSISVHGGDQPGLVYRVTSALAESGFNITDLSTHRTAHRRSPGYMLFLEGEIPNEAKLHHLENKLPGLRKKLKAHISLRKTSAHTF